MKCYNLLPLTCLWRHFFVEGITVCWRKFLKFKTRAHQVCTYLYYTRSFKVYFYIYSVTFVINEFWYITHLFLFDFTGVIIIDNGQCNSSTKPVNDNTPNKFLKCGIHSGGFSATDDLFAWKTVKIPVILVTQETGKLLDSLMDIELSDIPRIGKQKVTILKQQTHFRDEFW